VFLLRVNGNALRLFSTLVVYLLHSVYVKIEFICPNEYTEIISTFGEYF
jgi:hypothetical protein